MTRGELELAHSYDRVLYYGHTKVKIQQICSYWSKAETVTVRSVSNPKERQLKCSFAELSAVPSQSVKEDAA